MSRHQALAYFISSGKVFFIQIRSLIMVFPVFFFIRMTK
jgi:hypothetical protein